MLSDEEKKALEILKDREYDFDELYCTFGQSFIKPYDKSIGIILELIEKQSKEIEELKKYKRKHSLIKCHYIAKDKIKAKIEEVEQWELYNMKIPRLSTLDERLGAKIGIKYVLQSLLEKE